MKEDKDILKQIGHRDGMTVPEGYFADFAARMASSLPVTPFEESAKVPAIPIRRTFWQKVRPYVYMAAMFAGVWCMMKMFAQLTTPSYTFEPSPVMADALNNEIFVNDYIMINVDDWELMDEMIEDGIDISALGDSIMESADTHYYNEYAADPAFILVSDTTD